MSKELNFVVGQVYELSPGMYTTRPYYVEIIYVSDKKIITNIPNKLSLDIEIGSATWNEKIPRMNYIGMVEDVGDLLINQELI